MPMTRPTALHDITPIRPGSDAATLATGVYDRLFAQLEDLGADDWGRPTVCAPWTVGHLLGAARGHASARELLRQLAHGRRHARRHDGSSLDAMNELQVRDQRALSPTAKIQALREVAPAAVRARTRKPGLVRRLPLPTPPVGSMPAGLPERITLGYLDDVVLTRDMLMHRIDIARATGVDARLDGDGDRRVIADVVAEWGTRHGQPFALHLTGPAGGHYHHGADGPHLELDAAEFCWVVSGRGRGDGLLATPAMF